MIVDAKNLSEALADLIQAPLIAVDTETTGLNAYAGDRAFGISFATPAGTYWFQEQYFSVLKPIFEDAAKTFCGHNLHFDLGFLKMAGLEVKGQVYCTLVGARIEYNDHFQYSLDACAKRIGLEKDDAVKKYLDKNKLFTREQVPGKKLIWKNYRFWEVPIEIIAPYAERDAKIALDLYTRQMGTFIGWEKTRVHKASIDPVVALECKTVKVIQRMEESGIRIDRHYIEEAATHEVARLAVAARSFAQASGHGLIDSNKALAGVFHGLGIEPGRTKKGNPSFTDDVLEGISHPAAAALRDHRDANKRLGTYFSSFLYHSRKNGRIHCSFNAGGTATGRFSSSSPNLQNLSDEDESITPYPIRRAFIADPGCKLLSVDYQAMEYRLMLDIAGQMDVIEEVKSGKDLHQACADLMGVDRRTAKTINFLLLYGGGISKLAGALFSVHHDEDTLKQICRRYFWECMVTEPKLLENLDMAKVRDDVEQLRKADALQRTYFKKLPQVEALIEGVQSTAKTRGYVFNWMGRRSHFPVAKFAYAAPNYIIQGGCADIMRRALARIDELLKPRRSRLLLQIHDEVVIGLNEKELDVIEQVREAMIEAYPFRHLPMGATAYVGPTLHDLEEWHGSATRNQVQNSRSEGLAQAAV